MGPSHKPPRGDFDEPYTEERKQWALQTSQRLREKRRAGAVNRHMG
jgi:hypothetical protein